VTKKSSSKGYYEVKARGTTEYRALGGDGVTTYKTPEEATAMSRRLDGIRRDITTTTGRTS
jgi:hypothetical protein